MATHIIKYSGISKYLNMLFFPVDPRVNFYCYAVQIVSKCMLERVCVCERERDGGGAHVQEQESRKYRETKRE